MKSEAERRPMSDDPPLPTSIDADVLRSLLDSTLNAAGHAELIELANTTRTSGAAHPLANELATLLHPSARRVLPVLGPRYETSERINALHMILQLRVPIPIDPILAALYDRADAPVRAAAAKALGEIGGWYAWTSGEASRIVHGLTVALRHPDDAVREQAALSLGRLAAVEAADPLAGRLEEEENDRVRQAVALALGQMNSVRAVLPLLDSYDNGEITSSVCVDALAALGVDAVEPLTGVVRRWNVRLLLRQISALALGAIGDPGAVETLITVLERPHEHEDIRIDVTRALGQIGAPEALPTLRYVLAEPWITAELREALNQAIQLIEGRDAR